MEAGHKLLSCAGSSLHTKIYEVKKQAKIELFTPKLQDFVL